MSADAGRDVHQTVHLTNVGPDVGQIRTELLAVFKMVGFQPGLVPSAAGSVPDHDKHLSDQLDGLRDSAQNSNPDENLRIFHRFFESLPTGVSGTIRFRVKANIGLQHLNKGNADDAIRWLLEAFEEEPEDPRAIANKALALWLRGDAEEAYAYGLAELAANPKNEVLASYLPQIAVKVASVQDGLDGVPVDLRDTESVSVANAIFLRGRDRPSDWWDFCRSALKRFPGSEHLKLLVAASYVDQISRDEEAQRTQIYTAEQRAHLAESVIVLDASWQAKPWLLGSHLDDASTTLANAMIAYRLLHDREKALERAERIADEEISHRDIVHNAVMVALSFEDLKLATRLIALAPDDPDLAFHAGIIAVSGNHWQSAVDNFSKANVPEHERRVVEAVIAIAGIAEQGRPADGSLVDPAPLEAIAEQFGDSPRGLILIAQVANEFGLQELASSIMERAVKAVPADCHIATRLMVAHYASKANFPSTVIEILDGFLPTEGFEKEYQLLAIAHANEYPHRQRNLKFFEGLSRKLRKKRDIARAHASVLLDVGRTRDAVALLRKLYAENRTDAFIVLRLLQALHRARDAKAVTSLLLDIDLKSLVGLPEYSMAIAQQLSREGYPERAYPVAYDLVRKNTDDADIVLGYAGLGLLTGANPIFASPAAVVGSYVKIKSSLGQEQEFVIDEGGDFFGITVLSARSAPSVRVNGLKRGDTFEAVKFGQDTPEVWTVTDVMSKYIHLHHRVLEEFESRFPDKPGLARFTPDKDKLDAVLNIVKRGAKQSEERAQNYLKTAVPLAVAARGQGGNVIAFAQYVRELGGHIATSRGDQAERNRAIVLVNRYRGRGAVLDPYTAWVAAEMGVLPELKAYFGSLQTPESTISMIDRMIYHENEGRGAAQKYFGYRDGQFYQSDISDDFRDRQIAALSRGRDAIEAHCEIVPVLIPNELSDDAETILAIGGSKLLDAALLALDTSSLLLSDDLRYREICAAALKCDASWLQIALGAACDAGQMAPGDYGRAVVGLADRAHTYITLNAHTLYWIACEDAEGFPGLQSALRHLAVPEADMESHVNVFINFVRLLWPSKDLPRLKSDAATGHALNAMIAHRRLDWAKVLRDILYWSIRRRGFRVYMLSWLRGHFFLGNDDSKISAPTLVGPAGRKRVKQSNP